MREYELMYIIKPDLDEEATNNVVEKYSQLIANNEGEVINIKPWGRRRLAYEIKDYKEGCYMLGLFKGTPATVKELDRIFKIDDAILRHMITRIEA